MQLHDLKPKIKHKGAKRLGRGPGSSHGKTSCRGHKGAKSRAGRLSYIGFEGGNVPYLRKIPKKGFNHRKRIVYQIVNLSLINSKFKKEDKVGPDNLFSANLIKDKQAWVKVLGKGRMSKPMAISAHKFSKKAIDKIEKAGGKIECLTH